VGRNVDAARSVVRVITFAGIHGFPPWFSDSIRKVLMVALRVFSNVPVLRVA
jgi:hypothetical protein